METNMRKVILGIDIDGTVGGYINCLREYMAAKFDIPEDQMWDFFPEPIDYNFTNWKHVDTDFKNLHSEAVSKGMYEDMKVFPQASQKLWQLNNEDYHLRVMTSRFVKHGQNFEVVNATGKWLDKHDIPYRDLMFVHEKTDVFVDVLIDDSPYNILGFQKRGRPVIIFDAPYNQDLEGPRAHNWEQAYALIKEMYPNGIVEAEPVTFTL